MSVAEALTETSHKNLKSANTDMILNRKKKNKTKTHKELRQYTFFYMKPFLMPEPQFFQHNARNQAEIFLIFFVTFISLFNRICRLGLTLNIHTNTCIQQHNV